MFPLKMVIFLSYGTVYQRVLYANICENGQLRHLTHLQGKFMGNFHGMSMVCPLLKGQIARCPTLPNLHSSSFIKEDTQHWEDEFLHPAPPPLNLCSNMQKGGVHVRF